MPLYGSGPPWLLTSPDGSTWQYPVLNDDGDVTSVRVSDLTLPLLSVPLVVGHNNSNTVSISWQETGGVGSGWQYFASDEAETVSFEIVNNGPLPYDKQPYKVRAVYTSLLGVVSNGEWSALSNVYVYVPSVLPLTYSKPTLEIDDQEHALLRSDRTGESLLAYDLEIGAEWYTDGGGVFYSYGSSGYEPFLGTDEFPRAMITYIDHSDHLPTRFRVRAKSHSGVIGLWSEWSEPYPVLPTNISKPLLDSALPPGYPPGQYLVAEWTFDGGSGNYSWLVTDGAETVGPYTEGSASTVIPGGIHWGGSPSQGLPGWEGGWPTGIKVRATDMTISPPSYGEWSEASDPYP